MTTKAICSDLI